MMRIAIWIALSLSFIASAAHAGECGANLLLSDRYFSAVRAQVEAGRLTLAQLAAIAESEKPVNPLAFATPGSQTASAIRLFETLIANTDVKARWESTRASIRRLIDEKSELEDAREHASHETAAILRPQGHMKFDDIFGEFALAELSDHRPAIAFVRDRHLNVIDLKTKGTIGSIPLPKGLNSLTLTWHRDLAGADWLYFHGTMEGREGTPVYRWKFGGTSIEPIEMPPGLYVQELRSLFPGHIVAFAENRDGGFSYKLDSGKFVEVPKRQEVTAAVEASPPANLNIRPVKSSKDVLFIRKNGERLLLVAGASHAQGDLYVLAYEDPAKMIQLSLPQSIQPIELSMFEENEHLYFAAICADRIQIYEPYKSPKPIVEVRTNVVSWAEGHWFHSPEGDLLLGVPATDSTGKISALKTLNPQTRTLAEFPLPDHIQSWATSGKQTYFTVITPKLEVHSVFNTPLP